MDDNKEKEERVGMASSWLMPLEPEVEIKESEKTLEMTDSDEENIFTLTTMAVEEGQLHLLSSPNKQSEQEEPSSDSEEENNLEAVQELESVLVDKMCEVCGNFFQTFELVNAERNKPLLSTCETCSYYITPPVVTIYGSSEFSCDKCPKMFSRKDKLLRHKVTHSGLKPFSCDLCDKSFKRHDKLTEHIKLVHADGKKRAKDKCSTCGAVQNIITINVGENEAEFIKLCEACNLLRQEQLIRQSQNPKIFPCDLCSRSFSRKDHVARHRLSHLDVKPYECSICKKSFSRNDRLLRHLKTHPGSKPFSCRVCSKAFSDREELKIHQLTHPKPNGRGGTIKCEICQKELRDQDKLRRHLTTHVNIKSSVCEICGKTFKLHSALIAHQRVHSDLSPYKCGTCGMEFKVKEIYSRHLLVHSSVNLYSCDVCSKKFKRKDKLQAHNLVHIDVKPYTCNLCDGAFKRKDKYTRHLKQVHRLGLLSPPQDNSLIDISN